jgi:hypothetical protein
MTDLIINRRGRSVTINSSNLNRTYDWISDNVDVSDNVYIVEIYLHGNRGTIIVPRDKTNLILFK